MERSSSTAQWLAAATLAAAVSVSVTPVAQEPRPAADSPPGPLSAIAASAQPSDETATLVFFNRPIVSMRASVLGRRPSERAAAGVRVLDDLAARGITEPVDLRRFNGGVLLQVGSRTVFALTAPDIDELSGETLDEVGTQTVARLRQALDEAREAHAPAALLRAAVFAALALAVTLSLLWAIARAHRGVLAKLVVPPSGPLRKLESPIRHAARLTPDRVPATSGVGALRRRGLLLPTSASRSCCDGSRIRDPGASRCGVPARDGRESGAGVLRAVPGLFTVVLIALIARFLIRLMRLWFDAVERGR